MSILKVLARKPIAEIDDNTLILADQAEKAVAQLRAAVKELLADKGPPEKANELADLLTEGTWTHDYGIPCEAAKAFGLTVSDDMPDDVLRLMSLFPQPMRRQASVEYLPVPRRYERPSRGSAAR